MRKYQVEIKINDFENCRKIWTYADANNIHEALNAATMSILEKLDPGVERDEATIQDMQNSGWKKIGEQHNKIALNKCYGAFKLPEDIIEQSGKSQNYYSEYTNRADKDLISFLEKSGGSVKTNMSYVQLIDIPNNVTDWVILDNDGFETVYFTVDGKIYHK